MAVAASGCGGGSERTLVSGRADLDALAASVPTTQPFLTAAEVGAIVVRAAEAADAVTMVIAVTDRAGVPLAVFRKPGAPATVVGNFGAAVDANDHAVSLARTGAFFSNNQAPLSSRTVRFISGIHFPPGAPNRPPAALYGIENTNRGCPLAGPPGPPFNAGQALARPVSLNGLGCTSAGAAGCGLGIATGKANVLDSDPTAVHPGGIPIFKDGQLVGGIGVTGVEAGVAEFAAFVGSIRGAEFGPRVADPGVVVVEGVTLPFVSQTTPPAGVGAGTFAGAFVLGPIASPRGPLGVPAGWLIGPGASAELSAGEVTTIVSQAVAQALDTRAVIRLPLGSRASMAIAVSDLAGNIIGLFRMPDSTVFSVDVAATKARNVAYFSGPTRLAGDLPGVPIGTAVTNRTIGFGAQPLYPPGIDGTATGPFFQAYVADVATPCTQGAQPANLNQSGIVFFPGSLPLYRGGALVGGLGVSGDGVEQDDLVSAAGATGLAAPLDIRADRVSIGDVRLPFLKFPRNPEVP